MLRKYFIKESKLGTRILYGKVMNGIKPFNDLVNTVDYALLNEELMDHDTFIKGLSVFNKLNNHEITMEEANKEITNLVNSTDTVFYYKKTIYRVKDENKN